MFKLSFLVEDKHLPKVLHAVAGMALNLETMPVGNAKVVKAPSGKKVQQDKTAASSTDLIAAGVRQLGATTISSEKLKRIVADCGFSADSYSHFSKTLISAGVLERRERGMFIIKKDK